MSKRNIAKWWVAGVAGMALGLSLILASTLTLVTHLEPVTLATIGNLMPDAYARAMVTLILVGAILAGAGIGTQFGAWIAALSNSRRLSDPRWFHALLWSGVAGLVTLPLFGTGVLIADSGLIAYLVGAPDAILHEPATILDKQTIKKWSDRGLVAMGGGTIFSLLAGNMSAPGRLLYGLQWPTLTLSMLGLSVAGCGVIAVAVAWWAAVFNTNRLADRTWFRLLLWSGIIGAATMPLLGLGAFISASVGIAYLAAGPDSSLSARATCTPGLATH